MTITLSIEPGHQLGEKIVVRRGTERTVMFAKYWRDNNGMCLTGKKLKFENSVYKRDATLKLTYAPDKRRRFTIHSHTRKADAAWACNYDDKNLRTPDGITIDLDDLAWYTSPATPRQPTHPSDAP